MSLKMRVYRQCRLWHGYLSAFAFAALLFFAVTGVFLNHPDWFSSNRPRSSPVQMTLTPSQLQELRDASVPAELLTKLVAEQTTLYGEYKDGTVAMTQIFVRMRGARGSSDIRADLNNGSVAVTVERATTVALLNALHRGEQAGSAWRMFIDAIAAVLIAVSLIGYAIFFSMTPRLKTAVLVTGVSVLGTVALFLALVP